jgi:aspartate carbamoyltransferase regulatory subunit
MNVPSNMMGMKEIVKIENKILMVEEFDRIAIVLPRATVSLIGYHKVVSKSVVETLEAFVGLFKCPNPT